MQEMIGIERRQSLEGVGLVRVAIAMPDAPAAGRARAARAPATPRPHPDRPAPRHPADRPPPCRSRPNVNREDVEFSPLNRDYGVRERCVGVEEGRRVAGCPRGRTGGATCSPGWRRARGVAIDVKAVLRGRLGRDDRGGLAVRGPASPTVDVKRGGTLRRLNHERLETPHAAAAGTGWRCDHCRQVWWAQVEGVVPDVPLHGLPDRDRARRLARPLRRPLRATRADRPAGPGAHRAVVERPRRGDPDRVRRRATSTSCPAPPPSSSASTSATSRPCCCATSRRAPPTTSSAPAGPDDASGAAAMVLTLVQRRNHDLAYYREPRLLVDGRVAPPRIVIDNPVIARRHAHAVAFAALPAPVEQAARRRRVLHHARRGRH